MSKPTILIGIDDTDNLESRGTGRLARDIAARLQGEFNVLAVTRHQLLVDPRIPYTSHNSSAAIHLESSAPTELSSLFRLVKEHMLADLIPGSDPGLCVAENPLPMDLVDFGRRVQTELVTQSAARALASHFNLLIEGLAGSQDGIIGALAAVGLAASGEDGRYLSVGRSRELSGLQEVATVLATGIEEIYTLDGKPVLAGPVMADKLRPARRAGRPVLYVEWQSECWVPIKVD